MPTITRSTLAIRALEPAASRASDRVSRGRCDRRFTTLCATLCCALALAFAVGCGGKSKKTDPNVYANAIDQQEACCRQLADAQAREACISRIVRVDDEEVQRSDLNRATYACFADHFQCDPATGGVTKEASQKQYDCIDALDE